MLLAGLLEEIAKKLNGELQFRALIGLLTNMKIAEFVLHGCIEEIATVF